MLARIFVRSSRVFVLIVGIMLSSLAHAQEDMEEVPNAADVPKAKVSKSGKAIYLEFGNELIDAKGSTPSVEYIFSRTQFNFKRLIRLRENFQQEVREGKGDFGANK